MNRPMAPGRSGFAALCLLFACTAASADQMYKWTDPEGHVHYSQTPPAGTGVKSQAVQVQQPQPYSTDPRVTQQNQQVSQQAAAQAQADAHDAEVAARNKAAQAQHCGELKAQLQLLQQTHHLFTVDANGERHYESDADRDKAVQQLQAEIASQCGGH